MKCRYFGAVCIAAFLTSSGGLAWAHHSVTASHLQDKTVTIKGTLKEFLWRNPHSLFKVEAPDDTGELAGLGYRGCSTDATRGRWHD